MSRMREDQKVANSSPMAEDRMVLSRADKTASHVLSRIRISNHRTTDFLLIKSADHVSCLDFSLLL